MIAKIRKCRFVMKFRKLSFFILVLLILVSATVYAHPGRTDGNGGHTNHSTGEYHYHHGYSEHQHYDMDGDGIADCLYNFKDNTAHKESSSSSSSSPGSSPSSLTDEYNRLEEHQSEETKNTVSTEDGKKKEEKKEYTVKKIVGIILGIIFFVPLMLYVPICLIAFMIGKVRDITRKTKKK